MVAAPTKKPNWKSRNHTCPTCAKKFRLTSQNNPNCATCVRRAKEARR